MLVVGVPPDPVVLVGLLVLVGLTVVPGTEVLVVDPAGVPGKHCE